MVSRLAKAGVPASTVNERCELGPFALLFAVGCYNYSNFNSRIPDRVLLPLQACNGPDQADCSNGVCQTQFLSTSAYLANSSSPQLQRSCVLMLMGQYLARYNSPSEVTSRLNCYFRYPPPLALGLAPKRSALTTSALAGIVIGSIACLVILVAAVVIYKRRFLGGCLGKGAGKGSKQWTGGIPGLTLERFSYSTLRRATKKFSEERLLGRGGSGKVFMGELQGTLVAVKVITREAVAGGAKVRRLQ